MKENKKFLSGLLVGAAAGAVVTLFLQGEKGHTLIKNVKSGFKDATSELKNGVENIDNTLERWINKGRNLIDEIRNRHTEDLDDYEEIFS